MRINGNAEDPNYNSTVATLHRQLGRNAIQGNDGNAIIDGTNRLPRAQTSINIDPSQAAKIESIIQNIERQHGSGMSVEQAFVMLGSQDGNGNVNITDVVIDENFFRQQQQLAMQRVRENGGEQRLGEISAVNSPMQVDRIRQHLGNRNITNPVVIHGHTHPESRYGNISNNYSLHDMWAYRDLQASADSMRSDAHVYGMLINNTMDVNVVGFNSDSRQFEKHDNVSVGRARLPSFSGDYHNR